jgi:hypothetical protein
VSINYRIELVVLPSRNKSYCGSVVHMIAVMICVRLSIYTCSSVSHR